MALPRTAGVSRPRRLARWLGRRQAAPASWGQNSRRLTPATRASPSGIPLASVDLELCARDLRTLRWAESSVPSRTSVLSAPRCCAHG
jgi:hypothetical protein